MLSGKSKENEMESMIFKVRPTKEAEFAKLVRKFNRCLKASGMTEIQPVLLGKCQIDLKIGSTNLHYSVEGNQYQLSFPEGMVGMQGYRFVGEYRKIDDKWHRTLHSDDIRDELEVCEANMRCDHCGKNIRNRNGYFFFRDQHGELTVVGSTCVDAFLGFNVRALLEALGDATEFERSCGSVNLDKETIGVGIESFIGMVSDATNGFTSWRRNSDENPTSQRLKDDLNNAFFGTGKAVPVLENVNELVDKCREYWNKVYKFDDLTVNSRKALEGNFVPLHWAGIAGWAVFKAVFAATHPAKEFRGNGEFVGKVGDAVSSRLIPRRYVPFTNRWGDAWAIHFDDENGNHYLTFSSSKKLVNAVRDSIGKALDVKFTIVGQEVDRGWNVNRIKSVTMA